jgi:peptide/nickel transport system permease protein
MAAGFLTTKLVRTVLTLWGIVTFVFIVLRATGDPTLALLPDDATPEMIAHYRELWGYDRPIWVQYVAYWRALLAGDLGVSHLDMRPALTTVLERVPATLLLGAASLLVAILVGVPLGIAAALRRNTALDRTAMALAVFGFAIPNFFFGILLILLFSLQLRWLPSSGYGTPAHLVMPALTLGLATAGALARFTRSSMLEVMGRTYMRLAEAKGLSPARRILLHALPNAAIPLVTVLGLSLGGIIAGAIVSETVFAWPGVGRLLVTSVTNKDLAVVQCIVLLVAATMVAANLLVDLLYGVLDPRIRVQSRGGDAR